MRGTRKREGEVNARGDGDTGAPEYVIFFAGGRGKGRLQLLERMYNQLSTIHPCIA